MKWSEQYAGSDGKIHLPTAEEDAERQRRALSFRKSASRAANWTFAGPNKTYDTDGVTKVTWQTNIYSLDIAASNSNVLFAGGEDGGMWKTTDKGLSWTLVTRDVSHGSFSAVKLIQPMNKLYMRVPLANSSSLPTREQAGLPPILNRDSPLQEIAISSTNPSIVILATNKG